MIEQKSSSWDKLRAKSTYHFDHTRKEKHNDVIIDLGHITPTWEEELTEILINSKPANWETRGFKGEGVSVPRPELEDEEYDLARLGIDPKVVITDLSWKLGPKLQAVSDAFALDDCMARIHVQRPGQVWHRHIDKLYKWFPENPSQIMRIFIQLTDWQPGQFWEYGNYHWTHWRAGSVTTFDWQNLPHCTANAGFEPRVTLQLTGIRTGDTMDYLAQLPR
jgi:hypothetical protein